MGKRKSLLSKKGFTLVEILVVLVILAILAAVSIPTLTGYITVSREKICYSTRGQAARLYQAYCTARPFTGGESERQNNFQGFLTSDFYEGSFCSLEPKNPTNFEVTVTGTSASPIYMVACRNHIDQGAGSGDPSDGFDYEVDGEKFKSDLTEAKINEQASKADVILNEGQFLKLSDGTIYLLCDAYTVKQAVGSINIDDLTGSGFAVQVDSGNYKDQAANFQTPEGLWKNVNPGMIFKDNGDFYIHYENPNSGYEVNGTTGFTGPGWKKLNKV